MFVRRRRCCSRVAWPLPRDMIRLLAWSVVVVGAVAVFCSVMIYASVRREFWDFPQNGCSVLH